MASTSTTSARRQQQSSAHDSDCSLDSNASSGSSASGTKSSKSGWLSSLFHSLLGGGGGGGNSSSSAQSATSSLSTSRRTRSTKRSAPQVPQQPALSVPAPAPADKSVPTSTSTSKAASVPAVEADRTVTAPAVPPKEPAVVPPQEQTAPHEKKRASVSVAAPAMATSQQQHAPSARKGVRWDEVQVQEQQKEASERHAGPAMTPYAVFATPKDWKTPPVAAYPYMNRYRLIGKMGEGAFSTVYRAIDSKTNLLVALKLVSKNQLNDTQRNNILRETTLLRRIKHGNIIRLVDFHETPLHYALALELMSGGEIFHQLVSQVCFSEPVCRHVIGQVAEGLRYLHEELGVVHRDIKLENLLYEPIPPNATGKRPEGLGPNVEDDYIPGVGGAGIGLVKIADFGLSKVVFNATTKTPCGTVGYTAPEILNDQRYSKGVDMWALGCVLYTILSGFPPFFDDDPRGLTEKVANGQFAFLSPWWDDISSEAKDLICHLLQVNPKKRYTISQFLAHPWMQGDTVAPAAIVPDVQVSDHADNDMDIPTGPNIAKYGDWRDLELPEVLQTPMDEYYTGMEMDLDAAPAAAAAKAARGASGAATTAAAVPAQVVVEPYPAPAHGQPAPQTTTAKKTQASKVAAAAAPLDTPTYRRLRTPHPVPDGITKEMLAAPFQVYQSIAEGETRPEHIGMVRGGVVPHQRKASPLSSTTASATKTTPTTSSATAHSARAQKRAGHGFELDLGNSKLFNRRRGPEPDKATAVNA